MNTKDNLPVIQISIKAGLLTQQKIEISMPVVTHISNHKCKMSQYLFISSSKGKYFTDIGQQMHLDR